MRCFVAQLHQKSRSIGSPRNFCTCSGNEATGAKWTSLLVRQVLGIGTGYGLGRYLMGDMLAFYKKNMRELNRNSVESRRLTRKMWHDLADQVAIERLEKVKPKDVV